MALAIVLNAKTHRPSVCNAAESLLVHEAWPRTFVPRVVAALQEAGVTVHGDAALRRPQPGVVPATEDDYDAEYLSLDISAAVVRSLDAAVDHIRRHSSGHTEAIVTGSLEAARRFTAAVDSAAVWSTPAPGSPTAASSASAPRSGSRPRSCTPAARWGCPR